MSQEHSSILQMLNYLTGLKNYEINTRLVSNFLQMNSMYKETFAATELRKHYIHNVWNKKVSIRKLAMESSPYIYRNNGV